MNTPRFTVGSVTGYPIKADAIRSGKLGSKARPVTTWYVHDSAYGYAIVKTFKGSTAEAQARDYAHGLEQTTRPRRAPRDHITEYLGYPVLVDPQGFHVHQARFGTFAGARRHIRTLRRDSRTV